MWPVVASLLVTLVGLFGLRKDWTKHPTRGRWAILGSFILLPFINFMQVRSARKESDASREQIKQLEIQVTRLNQSVEDERLDNERNYDRSKEAFDKLDQKFTALQARVTTTELQKELADVRGKLEATRKALAPGPKATLEFGFVNRLSPDQRLPFKAVAASENPVSFDFGVFNPTQVHALRGMLWFAICNSCRFVKEMPGWNKSPVDKDTVRYTSFDHIFETAGTVYSVEVVVPEAKARDIQFSLRYECETCVIDPPLQTIRLKRVQIPPTAKVPDPLK